MTLGERIGAGKAAEVFAIVGAEPTRRVAKLYRDPSAKPAAFREAAMLALVADAGLPVPDVYGVRQIEGRWAVLMDRAEGAVPAAPDDGLDWSDASLQRLARLHRSIHRMTIPALPALQARLRHRVGIAPRLSETQRHRLLAALELAPEGARLCHGDFHPWNVAVTAAGRETILDWLDATAGDPAADVARSAVLLAALSTMLAARYVAAYAEGDDDITAACRIWLPIVAAARLAENVAAEEPLLLRLADGEVLF